MKTLVKKVPPKFAYAAAVGVVAIGGLGLANAAPLDTGGDAEGVTFGDNISARGTGCPGNSAGVNVSADGTVVTISYDQFSVQTGGSNADRLKSCTVDIPVKVPTGISLSLLDVTYRGTSMGLDKEGITAYQSAKYWLAGSSVTNQNVGGSREVKPDGPSGDWQITDSFGALGLNPTCKSVNSRMRLTSTLTLRGSSNAGGAVVATDTTDVQSTALMRFQIRRCNA